MSPMRLNQTGGTRWMLTSAPVSAPLLFLRGRNERPPVLLHDGPSGIGVCTRARSLPRMSTRPPSGRCPLLVVQRKDPAGDSGRPLAGLGVARRELDPLLAERLRELPVIH